MITQLNKFKVLVLSLLVLGLFSSVIESATGDSLNESSVIDFAYTVDSINGNDTSSEALNCLTNTTFQTIDAAVDCALGKKKIDLSSQILIRDGVYRETIDLWLNPDMYLNNLTPIIVQAETTGNVIISGSDRINGWVSVGNGLYQRTINEYPLSLSTQLSSPAPLMSELTRRREMVFADGLWLKQQLDGTTLQAGQFSVDANGTVTIAPHDGILDDPFVQVSIRDVIWKQNWVNNITVEGIRFQHAASLWDNGRAAVTIGGSRHFTMIDSEIFWNNGVGIFLGSGTGENTSDSTILRTAMNRNGKGGINASKAYNLQIKQSETSRNNWRGDIGGYYSWWVGNKFTYARGFLLEDHIANENASRGIWFDLDNEDVIIRRLHSEDNRLDGLFLEVSQGPFLVTESTFINNGRHGVMGANTEQVTLDGIRSVYNQSDQINLTADWFDGPRDQINHVTGETMTLWLQNWTIQNSIIGTDSGSDGFLAQSTLEDDADGNDWTLFRDSYSAQYNCWFHTSETAVFRIEDPLTIPTNQPDFAGWQTESGESASSTFQTSDTCPTNPPTAIKLSQTDSQTATDSHILITITMLLIILTSLGCFSRT